MTVTLFAVFLFFFNDTATTEIYTLSLHDALPISLGIGDRPRLRCLLAEHDVQEGDHRDGEHGGQSAAGEKVERRRERGEPVAERVGHGILGRSEEHTSELQSRLHLVCRLLLEKKKKKKKEKQRRPKQSCMKE